VAGVSLTSVQRIWRTHGLAPHRVRTFKLSNDPKFAAECRTTGQRKLNAELKRSEATNARLR
jgi:hypothetical protein